MADIVRKSKQPLASLSAFSYIPERRDESEQTYFGNQKKGVSVLTYDRIFRAPQGYNNKIHRDDREHAKSLGLNVNAEEMARSVPVLNSSHYGKRLHLNIDPINRSFVRVAHVHAEFYRKNGISKSVEEGYGTVVPD
ncbi:uncharacterized protein C5orf49 homolog [Callorhinchus milii]|uniref:Cilia and flagella associated protein 90 n=1 Tax=Callorhinchus milii TaxID=7868 RepID=A0A4W3HHX2_CALMI|nr:uncharacterized protein C5orf49 homolog [Callorhinchus milii]|eukprot:gi/632965092/ref/XP_007898719.1/ PREDICTED: uncharacterized protein C5orf49 homolog [Callorhinchus milii]